jgi:glycine dehydrogenase subunit 2
MRFPGTKGLVMDEPLIFEKFAVGSPGVEPIASDVPAVAPAVVIPERHLRGDSDAFDGLPDVPEVETVRHFTRLSTWNFGVDTGFYPLGSCTMKYNPKVNEDVARLKGFTDLHPYAPTQLSQGALELMSELEGYLCEISGMDAVTLQPSAGAHGEFCALLMIAEYFRSKGKGRSKVIIPDTAHGTNPASSHLAGFKVVSVKSGPKGHITLDAVKRLMDTDTAALMLTNPNTLGLFEEEVVEIAKLVHARGGFVFCDGANLNALMGIVRLGDLGVDLVQFNLHKTFATPHGGGGPGAGPVGVKKKLAPFLPTPRIKKLKSRYELKYDNPRSIGRMKSFYGNFSIMVRAYAYIRRMGAEGLARASETAVLNANYIKERLKGDFHLPYNDGPCMHECVFSDKFQKGFGVTTLDIAKRLMDYGFHPPTIYFPLVVPGAMMVEPTETETLGTLDSFIAAMSAIAAEAASTPELLKNAPQNTRVGRVDETRAAREPILRWRR